jgi:pimeloyl-ACP methyl ester carboxylesterase
VGERRLSFYGVSYGTLMGQQYAEEFPTHVRALALDSNMDHSLGTRAFLDTETATAQDSFDEFVAGCQRDTRCVLHDRDIRALWHSLLARADRGELVNPFDPETTMSSVDLINFVYGAFYGPAWFQLAEILVVLDTGVVPADPGASAQLGSAMRLGGTRASAAAADDPTPPEAVEYAFPAVFCEDWSVPVRDYREFAGHVSRMARIAPDMRFSPLALSAVTTCLGWPAKVVNPQHPLHVSRLSPTLLLVNALHDPATPYTWATDDARQLGREAVLVTYEGWGHAAYGREPCTTGAVDRYLLSLIVAARGTRCAAAPVEPPTQPSFAARTKSAPNRSAPVGPRPDLPGWF